VDCISIQSDRSIIISHACSFSTEPDSAIQLYSAIFSHVKRVLDFYFKQHMLLAFHVQIVSCGGLNLFMDGGTISNKLYHAVD
jgi:hypothetical protein